MVKKKQRSETENNFVFGFHAVQEALGESKGNKLFLLENTGRNKVENLKKLAKEQSVPVKWVPKQKLDQLSNKGVHQGCVLAVTPYTYLSLNELLQKSNSEPFFLILAGLEDPHNLGAIMRTADAAGVDGIIIPKHRASGITPVVAKASTGAVEHIRVARVTNLTQA